MDCMCPLYRVRYKPYWVNILYQRSKAKNHSISLLLLCTLQYVKTFNMDEYVKLPRAHKESYHTYMWQNLFAHIDIQV